MSVKFHQTTLPNGLTILAESSEDARTSAVGFFVKTGARDEPLPVMGVSHFLEHMMFKGTARRTADDVNREFDEIGADYNAYTSHEKTVYYAHVLPEYLPKAIDLLGDMLRPALREDDFSMEKNVILEEISMYEDRPQWRLQDTLLERYFGDHALGYRVLGTVDSIKALQASQMRQYFEQRYSPDNIVVSAAGQIDFDKLVKEVQKVAGHWQPTGANRNYIKPMSHTGDHQMVDKALNRHYIGLICPGPSLQDENRYAASVLSDVIGDSDGSKMYWSLVDPGHADEADLSHMGMDQTGCYLAYASCDPDRKEKVRQMLMEVLDTASSQTTDQDVQRTKNKLATQVTLHGESSSGRMRALGSQWLNLGKYTSLADVLQKMMAVTLDDIQKHLATKPFTQRCVIELGPGE
ncbi:MAG: insulinase family protein [Phycisphaeraceae bacterium]|nr:insulinase family protein [Phycisphaeraceae bacterium]